MQTLERFWNNIEKTDSCWNWKASLFKNGYGQFSDNYKKWYAHRFSYQLLKGELIEGLTIDHLCRNRACVNPEHLEQVTKKVNNLRGEGFCAKEARQTHCIHGHEFNEDNTYWEGNKRHCRPCNTIHRRILRETKGY